MKFIDHIFLWIGNNFTTEVYMVSTRMQGILWSMADIVLVFILLKMAGLSRIKAGEKKIFIRYYLLWSSAILTPLLGFARTPREFFILESIICGIQFLILAYTVIVESKHILNFFGRTFARLDPFVIREKE